MANTATGVIVAVSLYFTGTLSPMLWSFVGTPLRFLPDIGSAVSALLPIALAAAVSRGWGMTIENAFVIIRGLIGPVMEPLLYGHSTGLSPFAAIVSALSSPGYGGPLA